MSPTQALPDGLDGYRGSAPVSFAGMGLERSDRGKVLLTVGPCVCMAGTARHGLRLLQGAKRRGTATGPSAEGQARR
jgi:hypothetical protein